jgi:hypothetical protein
LNFFDRAKLHEPRLSYIFERDRRRITTLYLICYVSSQFMLELRHNFPRSFLNLFLIYLVGSFELDCIKIDELALVFVLVEVNFVDASFIRPF